MRASTFLLVLAVGLCVPLVACWGGGDGRMSDEEYFERLEELLVGADAAIAADEDNDPTVVDQEDFSQKQADHYEFMRIAYKDVSERLLALDPMPPGDLVELNRDFGRAMEDHSENFAWFARLLRDDTEHAPGLGLVPSRSERAEWLCLELEHEASAREIGVDLSCDIRTITVDYSV